MLNMNNAGSAARRQSPIGTAALCYAEAHGLAVFPCLPRTKAPMVGPLKNDGSRWDRTTDPRETRAVGGGFHRATTHVGQLLAWWDREPDANVAIRLGGVPRVGLVEADTAEAEAFLAGVDWAGTPRYRASRGVNYVVRVPDDIAERPVRHLWPERFANGLEVKTGAGFVVAPPSVHPSGHVYAWCPGASLDDVPLAIMPPIIADEVRRVDAARMAIHKRHASTASTASIVPMVPTVKRVAAYLRTVPSGLTDGRKTAAYALAAALHTRLACAPSEVSAIVVAWNACNVPPLVAGVCEGIIANALTYAVRKAA